jgi:pimeloyl-ACP methyl ester carboxylesterase
MPDIIRTAGLVLTEHEFSVPLDHDRPDGERISVFAREVADPDGRDRPFLVFLEGGPGFEATRPARHPTAPSWLDRALSEFRVLMLDQRGTGRSTPAGALPGRTPEEQAEYLKHFRADSIVRDAEWVRRELNVDRWSVLGQSVGGFCVLTYLSRAPEGLREAFFTGGLPPIGRPVDDVYRGTYDRVLDRNRRYYDRYMKACGRASRRRIEAEDVRLRARRHRAPLPQDRPHGDGIRRRAPALHPRASVGSPPSPTSMRPASSTETRSTPRSTRPATPTAARPVVGRRLLPEAYDDRSSSPAASTRGCSRTTQRSGRSAGGQACERRCRASTTRTSCAGTRFRRRRPSYAEDMYVERVFSEDGAADQPQGLGHEDTSDGLRADDGRISGG